MHAHSSRNLLHHSFVDNRGKTKPLAQFTHYTSQKSIIAYLLVYFDLSVIPVPTNIIHKLIFSENFCNILTFLKCHSNIDLLFTNNHFCQSRLLTSIILIAFIKEICIHVYLGKNQFGGYYTLHADHCM